MQPGAYYRMPSGRPAVCVKRMSVHYGADTWLLRYTDTVPGACDRTENSVYWSGFNGRLLVPLA